MKTGILVLVLFTFFGMQVPGELNLVVSNITPQGGDVYVAVYDHSESYMSIEMAVFKKMVAAEGETQTIVISDVPYGEYAIAVFQDLNGNGELDIKGAGIPKEPFGFSNNARGKMGPPNYKNAKFSFTDDLEMNIELVNNAKK
jgi:uncharacterized protein (DUF2141 family)